MSDLINRLRSIGDRVIECVPAQAMNRVADYMTEVDDLCNEAADRVAELEAENARLWAWHDEAVSRVSCHLCAVNLPQPLKRDK